MESQKPEEGASSQTEKDPSLFSDSVSGERQDSDAPVEVTSAKTTLGHSKMVVILNYITVEPMVVGVMYVIVMYSMLAKQYIYMRLAMDYNLTTTDREESCNESTANKSDPNYILQQKVSAETSQWILYLATADFIVAIFTSIILGAWSDKVGRKIPMLISLFGLFILMLTYVIVVNLTLPVPVLIIGHFLCGLSGDLGTVLACSFSHISDITKPHNRTMRMAVLETCIGIGGFIASISGGVWASNKGFVEPFWLLLALSALNMIYIALRLENTSESSLSSDLKKLFTKEPFVHMYEVVKPHPENKQRHTNIITYVICFVLMYTVFTGVREILVVYEIGLPFCWDALLVGLSNGLLQVGYFVGIFLLKVFPGVSSEFKLVIVGVISNVSSCIVLACAQSTWMIFLGIVLQLFFNLPSPILRSQASRLVSQDEVGSVFALLSLGNNIGNLIASLLFNSVFGATIDSNFPGAAFLLGAGLFAIFTPLYWWVYNRSKQALSDSNQFFNQIYNEDDDEE